MELNLTQFNERSSAESFIKNYDENCNRGYFLEADVKYPKNLFSLRSDFSFSPGREKTKKCKKLVYNIKDKKYVFCIKALKQALNHGLIQKRVHSVTQFNQKAWMKPYIDMNPKLRKEAKNEFEKDFFQPMNNCFWKNNGECKK